ncbi:MAG: diguanylate cyclase domain-containing protein, partial [Solirubrobacteraceae bacterium]
MSDRRAADGRPRTPSDDRGTPGPDYPGLLRQVPAVLYTADPGELGAWHYVSPQIEQVLGFTPEEWCADPGSWRRQLHPDDVEWVQAEERAGMASGDADGVTEYRMRHRDGHVVWVRDDAVLREGVDGIVRWHGVLSDITERKLAEAELELRVAQQAAVARLGEHALEGATQAELMQEAVDACVTLLGMDIAAVAEYLPALDAFRFRVAHGLPDAAAGETVPGGRRCQSGYALMTGAPAIVSDWETERRFARSRVLTNRGARCGLTVVIVGRGAPFGALGCHSLTPREIKQGDVDFVQSLANVLGDVVERELTNDDIRHRALHDPLTALPNRALFLDRLAQATERLRRRPDSLTAVLSLDLDRFKLVNDSLGHAAGDELLAAIAPRLRQAVRSSDTVARFGG